MEQITVADDQSVDVAANDPPESILLDASQYLIAYKVVLSITCLVLYVYLERMKSFERGNLHTIRDSLMIHYSLAQAILLTYVLTVYQSPDSDASILHLLSVFVITTILEICTLQVCKSGLFLKESLFAWSSKKLETAFKRLKIQPLSEDPLELVNEHVIILKSGKQ